MFKFKVGDKVKIREGSDLESIGIVPAFCPPGKVGTISEVFPESLENWYAVHDIDIMPDTGDYHFLESMLEAA
jgi:hypothetical protein